MGKVHGSLARAGKVKSQTPKVYSICPPTILISLHSSENLLTLSLWAGRTAREEEDSQGSREEENLVYSSVRECYYDGWQEEGKTTLHVSLVE